MEFENDDPIMVGQQLDQGTLILFGRCDREKEEWRHKRMRRKDKRRIVKTEENGEKEKRRSRDRS